MYKANTNKNKFTKSYDSLYNLIHKIFKPLNYRCKQLIKNKIKETNANNLKISLYSISTLVTDEYTRNKFVPDENRQDFITSKIMQMELIMLLQYMMDEQGKPCPIKMNMLDSQFVHVPQIIVCWKKQKL